LGRARQKRKANKSAVAPQRAPAAGTPRASAETPTSGSQLPAARKIYSGRALWIAAGLIVATVAVYAQVWQHAFVAYDDPKYVTENPIVSAGLTMRGVSWALTTGTDANWFPLTWLTHMLDVQLYGMNPGGHHITNLLLHIVNTLLLFGLLHWMTGALGRSAFVAALFAVHPLHVESVSWVAERKDVLSTSFLMLTLWAYVWYVRQPRMSRYALVLVFFALGLMSKPMLVTLPFLLLVLDVWPLGRMSLGGERSGRSGSVRRADQQSVALHLVREKLPLFGLAIASSMVTFLVQRSGGAVVGLDAFPLGLRVANALVSYVAYIAKMLWPTQLAAFYPYPTSVPAGLAAGALVILIGVSVAVVRAGRRYPYLPVGWLWYFGMLLPVIGLVQVGNQALADRYTYVPMIGLFIIVAWGISDLLSRWRYRTTALPIVGALVIAACAITARAQVSVWRNSETLFAHAIDVTRDNHIAQNNLGRVLAGDGKVAEAIEHYKEALRIKPGFATAHTNLGAALMKQGKVDEAIAHFTEGLRIKPDFAEAHSDLAVALVGQGKVDEGIAHYAEAVRLKPDFPEAQSNWALALAGQGKLDDAIVHYNEALRLNPSVADVHNNLGFALASQGKYQDAIAQYKEAVRLKPDFVLAHFNLGISLANLDKRDEAIREFREVLRIAPSNEPARRALEQLGAR
jgi:tetratricopeptide (TPR) repeat protein